MVLSASNITAQTLLAASRMEVYDRQLTLPTAVFKAFEYCHHSTSWDSFESSADAI